MDKSQAGKVPDNIQDLKNKFQDADCVWFFVNLKYRILHFNAKAAANSMDFHNKQIAPGQSILDYARDTKNNIDSLFIECFGKAASGQQVQSEQRIEYNSAVIHSTSIYTPVYHEGKMQGISIEVYYTEDAG